MSREQKVVSVVDKNSTPGTVPAAIYARTSEDPRGLEHGVSRQSEDCKKLAADRGWDVVARYTDNDISALRDGDSLTELLAALNAPGE